jgi:hypothetical protein
MLHLAGRRIAHQPVSASSATAAVAYAPYNTYFGAVPGATQLLTAEGLSHAGAWHASAMFWILDGATVATDPVTDVPLVSLATQSDAMYLPGV